MPAWLGAPPGTLPGVVALERVLARTGAVAVCVTRIAAYPTGFEVDLVTMTSFDGAHIDPLLFEGHRARRGASEEVAPEFLRFGVQFADGSKATNMGRRFHPGAGSPPGPVMIGGGGGGGSGSWRQTQWIWPLPPPGALTLVCEWPAAGIPLTSSELDARLILDAAERAQVIFSDADLPEPPDEDDGPHPVAFVR